MSIAPPRGRAVSTKRAPAKKPRPPRAAAQAPPDDAGATARRELERAATERREAQYLLRLYVTGTTPASARAIDRVRAVCEEHLLGRYRLEVIDIYQLPALAKDQQIIATPTLIKVLPSPLRRFIGDLSKVEKILFGLELRERS